jgi:hypothetical protein
MFLRGEDIRSLSVCMYGYKNLELTGPLVSALISNCAFHLHKMLRSLVPRSVGATESDKLTEFRHPKELAADFTEHQKRGHRFSRNIATKFCDDMEMFQPLVYQNIYRHVSTTCKSTLGGNILEVQADIQERICRTGAASPFLSINMYCVLYSTLSVAVRESKSHSSRIHTFGCKFPHQMH